MTDGDSKVGDVKAKVESLLSSVATELISNLVHSIGAVTRRVTSLAVQMQAAEREESIPCRAP